jgi:hypothetical protein
MKCTACGRANLADRRYCGGCGARLECRCARCDFKNAQDDAFCGGCGVGMSGRTAIAPAPTVAANAPPEKHLAEVHAVEAEPEGENDPDALTEAELAELMQPPSTSNVDLPHRVSQTDIDKLFGAS